jgi:HK97 family phage portal protein
MNRLEKFKKSYFPEVKSIIDSIFLKNMQFEDMSDVLENPYEKSDLVYVCISTTAKAIAQVPLVVQQKGSKGWLAVPESDPDQVLLNSPNTLMPTTFEFINALISHLLLSGHVWMLPFPPGAPKFSSLWLIRKANMEKVVDEKTGQLNYWNYTPGKNKSIILMPDEVSSVKFFNPKDDIMGMAPMTAGRIPISVDYKTSVYNEKFFDEGAVPGGIISTDMKLNETSFERIKKQFEDKHAGYRKAHRLAVLDSGLKYTQMGLSHKDMEFQELRRMNRESIMQVFGMKKIIISVTDNLNYAIAKVERKEWWQGTNLPLMNMVAEGLTFLFYPGQANRKIIFDTSNVEALHEDYKDKVITGSILFKMGFSPNEINERLELGFSSKTWRNFWYVPSNVVRVNPDGSLDTTGLNPALPSTPRPALAPPEPLALPEPEKPKKPKKEIEEDDSPSLFFMANKTEGFTEDEEILSGLEWKKLTASSQAVEWEFESKIRRIFFEIRKKALKLLFQKSISTVQLEEFLDEKKALIIQTVSIYESGVRLGADSIINGYGTGVGFNINDPQIIAFLTEKPIMVGRVVNTVRNQIRQALIDGMSANESIEQIATRIKKVMSNGHNRAMTIAVTEVGSALNFGRSIEIRDAGYTKKKWYTALDERVRPDHRVMHGRVVNVDTPWIVGGASLRYPGDPYGPARQIVNCRCIELPVKE